MVNKEVKSILFYSGATLALVLFAYLVFAADTDLLVAIGNFTTALPNPAEDLSFLYNITLNNTATVNSTFNVSGVSVTFPTSCTLTSGTNYSTFGLAGNTSRAYFSTSGSTLNWTNVTYLIRNSTIGSAFANTWFNLSCTTPGAYNMLINLTVGPAVNQSSRPFQINDTETADDIIVASQGTETANNYGFYEDRSIQLNVSLNLTTSPIGAGFGTSAVNVTEVNITLPTGCSLVAGTNLSSKPGTFTSAGQVLTWTGTAAAPILNNTAAADAASQNKSFFVFNLTCATPANASLLTIKTKMIGGTVNTTTLTLHINDFSGIDKGVLLSVNTSSLNASYSAVTKYNFSLQNTGTNYTINITNLTIVSPFTVAAGSAGTDALNVTVAISGTNVTWRIIGGATNRTLVENGTTRYFWFNASGSGNAPSSTFTSVVQITNATGQFEYNTTQSIRASLYDVPTAAAAAETTGGSAVAATIYTRTVIATSEEIAAGKTTELKAKEQIKFTIAGAQHSVGVKSLTATSITISVSSTPVEATMNVGDEKKFELTGDNTYDLSVKLNSIANNKASITVKSISEEIPPEEKEEAPATPVDAIKAATKSVWFWIILVIIVIIAVIAYIAYKKRK